MAPTSNQSNKPVHGRGLHIPAIGNTQVEQALNLVTNQIAHVSERVERRHQHTPLDVAPQ